MPSWLSLSLPNPFNSSGDHAPSPSSAAAVDRDSPDLAETLGRRLRGVASFLAPPPLRSDDPPSPSSHALDGIKSDLFELGDSFKSSLSLLSSKVAVTKISRFASSLLRLEDGEGGVGNGEDDGDDEGEEWEETVGITDEVVDFVHEISLRPECWTDFPLSVNADFLMSDVQKDHAKRIEQLVPTLSPLRHKVGSYLSEEQFWMIYFILLLPRLTKDDFKLLATTEIIEVREMLLLQLRNKRNSTAETAEQSKTRSSSEETVIKSEVQELKGPSQVKEFPTENLIASRETKIHDDAKSPENEDDLSYSDLEDGDSDFSARLSRFSSAQSSKGSLVNLGRRRKTGQSSTLKKGSESEESSDWLTVEDVDFDS